MDIDYIRMWSDDPAGPSMIRENIPGTTSYVSDLFASTEDRRATESVETTTTKNTISTLSIMIARTGT
jgi:hypothetical protein